MYSAISRAYLKISVGLEETLMGRQIVAYSLPGFMGIAALIVILSAVLSSLSYAHFVDENHSEQSDSVVESGYEQTKIDETKAESEIAQSGERRLRPPPGMRRPPPGGARRGEGEGRPGRSLRQHTATEAQPLSLLPATEQPPTEMIVQFQIIGVERFVETNMIPTHLVGAFPNRGNPNAIAPQDKKFSLPITPDALNEANFYGLSSFGILLNGVVLEPAAAEWYLGVRDSDWRYEAMGGAIPLGLDENHAHVQPNGMYHYHGEPIGYYNLHATSGFETPIRQIGWAFDGFPIYARFWMDVSGEVQEARSSYRMKQGERPSGNDEPGGVYDGAFTADYEFVAGLGPLDLCNGMIVKTPEFPEGTYAYFVTNSYPFIPRCFKANHVDIRRR